MTRSDAASREKSTRNASTGRLMFLTVCSPSAVKRTGSLGPIWSCTCLDRTIPLGGGRLEALQPAGHVDAVAVQIIALDDHVAEMYADPQMNCTPFVE